MSMSNGTATSEDDDLPPRLDSAHASPRPETISLPSSGRNTPSSSRPGTPSQQPSSAAPNLPTHAGFDLTAIKEALKGVKHETGIKIRPSVLDSKPQLVTPLALRNERPQSVPPPLPLEPKAHQRSASLDLDDNHNVLTVNLPEENRPKTADFTSQSGGDSFGALGASTSLGLASLGRDTLYLSTLPDDVVPTWGSPTTAKPLTSSFTSLPSPPNTFAFVNSFSAPGHDRTPVLSFGTASELSMNSFSNGGVSRNDKWDLPPLGNQKKASDPGLAANPWS